MTHEDTQNGDGAQTVKVVGFTVHGLVLPSFDPFSSRHKVRSIVRFWAFLNESFGRDRFMINVDK
jgi:hypothetical protein